MGYIFVIQLELLAMDRARTPHQKLAYLRLSVNIISQGLMKFSDRKDAAGADDMLPMFLYVIIMAAPQFIYSNLKYMLCHYQILAISRRSRVQE